jgi:hypothetical protein
MITLRIEPGLFSALREGFEAAICDDNAPIKSKTDQSAAAGAGRRGCPGTARPTDPGEAGIDRGVVCLGDCFAVGGEGHPRVTDDQWDRINALIDQEAVKAAASVP